MLLGCLARFAMPSTESSLRWSPCRRSDDGLLQRIVMRCRLICCESDSLLTFADTYTAVCATSSHDGLVSRSEARVIRSHCTSHSIVLGLVLGLTLYHVLTTAITLPIPANMVKCSRDRARSGRRQKRTPYRRSLDSVLVTLQRYCHHYAVGGADLFSRQNSEGCDHIFCDAPPRYHARRRCCRDISSFDDCQDISIHRRNTPA